MPTKVKADCLIQLMRFLNAVTKDPRIRATHVSIYMSLFHCWLENDCRDPVLVNRRAVMTHASISGVATYHRCIRDLHGQGYIRYESSYHPLCQSKVYMAADSIEDTRKVV